MFQIQRDFLKELCKAYYTVWINETYSEISDYFVNSLEQTKQKKIKNRDKQLECKEKLCSELVLYVKLL